MTTPTRLADVTLYVPARNAEATLGDCLGAVARLDPAPARVIVVVDPASRDHTVEHARATEGVEVIEQDDPGLPHARNLAFEAARTEWVASVDADVAVAPDWLGALVAARGRFQDAVVIAGRTEERVLGAGDAWRALMMPHHWGAHPVDGPFMVVSEAISRREAVVAVGGYRESLVRYGDDSRMCLDLRDAGFRLAYTPDARALHQRCDDASSVLDLRWNYAAPRQSSRLDDLEGLVAKLGVNMEYGRMAVARALAAGESVLALIGAVLPLHHAVRDAAALVARRALMSPAARAAATRRIARLALDSVHDHPAVAAVATSLLGAAPSGLEQGPSWPRWPAFEEAVRGVLTAWVEECGALLADADPSGLTAPAADVRARWALRFGGPSDPTRAGATWGPATSVTPWPAPIGIGEPAGARRSALPRSIAAALSGRSVVTLAPAPADLVPGAARVTIASGLDELRAAEDTVVLATLDLWPAPRAIVAAATARARGVVLGTRGPGRLQRGLEPLTAADLAEAVSAAGMRIDAFETLAGESFLWAQRP